MSEYINRYYFFTFIQSKGKEVSTRSLSSWSFYHLLSSLPWRLHWAKRFLRISYRTRNVYNIHRDTAQKREEIVVDQRRRRSSSSQKLASPWANANLLPHDHCRGLHTTFKVTAVSRRSSLVSRIPPFVRRIIL